MEPGDVNNEVSGDVAGHVVQAGAIYGDVHLGPDTTRQAHVRLREYLQSLAQADDKHEYRSILDDGPPLGEIYLQRVAVRDGDRLPAEQLLDGREGLQITGEPGAGKSSLLRRIAAVAARDLLAGGTPGFVPVLITANDLAAGRPLREALVAGTIGKTDQVLDSGQLAELFREPPLPDVPWLVLVDGLDEVVGVGGQRDVLELIRRSRDNTPYRFVVASRPIGSGGFGMMDEDRYPTYSILPFTDTDWITFAGKWFARYGQPDPEARAADLLARVDRTKLGVLTRIPLTASMICLLHLAGPEQALPDNQSQLYADFVRLLLSKFPKVDVRAQLRRTLEPHGAADAGSRLVDDIEPLMEYLAHVAQADGPATTMAALTARVLRAAPVPAGVSERDWCDVLAKVITATGLVTVRPNGDVTYLHPTIAEYLAARHLFRRGHLGRLAARRVFAPQADWPWPDLNIKVFLAANWVEADQDLGWALRRLLSRWHRHNNAGFIVELVRHGIPVDDRVVAATVSVLRAMIATARTPSTAWRYAVEWLRDLDSDAVSAEISRLVDLPNLPIDRWFEAIKCLLDVDWEAGMAYVPRFLADDQVSMVATTVLAQLVAKSAPDDIFEILVRLVDEVGDREHLRHLCTALLVIHPERGARAIAAGLGATQPQGGAWEDKLALLSSHAPELAMDSWAALLRATSSGETRRLALTNLAELVPERAAAIARDIVRDESMADDARLDVAILAAEVLSDGALLLAKLTTARIGPVARAMACAVWGARTGQRAEAMRRIQEIQDSAASRWRFAVPESMAVLDKEAAVAMMRQEILLGGHSLDASLRELRKLARWAPDSELAAICRSLARNAKPADALRVAKVATTVYHDAGVITSLIQQWDGSLAIDAMMVLAEQYPYKAAPLLAAFSRKSSESEDDRLRAAQAAYRLHASVGKDALRDLASVRGLSAESRLTVAKLLLAFDHRRGEDLLQALVAHRSTPARIRKQAEQLLR